MRDFLIVIVIIIYSFRILLGNYAIANEREIQIQKELGKTRDKAYKDKLTGVKSVNAYRERERDINAAIQEGSLEALAVVVCDLNDLKKVNDTQGHQAGDNYIREGCQVICNTFEHSPVFRIGGDEFVALLEGADYRQREKLINLFERDNTVRLHTGGVVIALGSADWRPGEDATLADVFARADATMYERKKALKAQKASA